MPAALDTAARPPNGELLRLAALHDTGLLDGDVSDELRAVVSLAAEMAGCPAAYLTLVGHDTLQACVAHADPIDPLPRCETVCSHTIAAAEPLVIEDLSRDPRFAAGLLVAQGLRFYAGVPVHAPDEVGRLRSIGALCVTDDTARTFDATARQALVRLGTLADALIAARAETRRAVGLALDSDRLASTLAREHRVFAQAERMTRIGSWRMSLADEQLSWSAGVYRIYGLPPGLEPTLQYGLAPYGPAAQARISACLARTIETGEPFDFEEDFQPASGPLRRVRCIGEREDLDGAPFAVVGVFQDVTERYRMEQTLRHAATTDALTGLVNRLGFERALEAAMARARHEGTPLMLAMIDLDGFKIINDTLGHPAGDDVLRAVGQALRTDAPPGTLAARLGGDEFAVIVEHTGLCANTDELACRLEEALRVPVAAAAGLLATAGTVGVAAFEHGDFTVRDLVHRADAALYAGKRARIGERRVAERRRAA